MAAKKKFYAVKKGYKTGIFESWDECKKQTQGFKGALFKGFATLDEAKAYLDGGEGVFNGQKFIKKDDNDIDDTLQDCYYVYVDGSYIDGKYSWGMAIYKGNVLVDTFNGVGTSQDASELHNVAGEIEGAMQAAKWAKENNKRIILCHDYIGLSQWALGYWKTNKDLTKYYAAFMKPYLHLINFKKVTGHTGVIGNELADKLAKKALGII